MKMPHHREQVPAQATLEYKGRGRSSVHLKSRKRGDYLKGEAEEEAKEWHSKWQEEKCQVIQGFKFLLTLSSVVTHS